MITMTYRFVVLSGLFVLLVLLLSGCGGEKLPPGMPKLHPATLTVMQDGNPLPDAEIVMTNTDPAASNWSSGGVTDQNGVLKLRTMGRYEGVPAGTYKVAVQKIEFPNITLPYEPDTPEKQKEYDRLSKEMKEHTFYVVDPKFGPGKSEFPVEITPSNLDVTIDVSPAVRIQVKR